MGRFINGDDVTNLGAEEGLTSFNLFAYCANNPVNRFDENGNWSLPNWAKVVIGVGIIAAAAAVTVATGGAAAGTLAFAVHCAAQGALVGAATQGALGAVTGGISGAVMHRMTTGSWSGATNAAIDGAATGFMTGAVTGAITGALSSPQCFVAGTTVLTATGAVAIEQIQKGDRVWAWDEETGDVALKEVVETYINETDELVHVFVGGKEIITTPEHPFYSPVKGWTDAVHLRAGDILVLINGEYVVVEEVQHEILETPVTVYNFQVEDYHTYFVTHIGILVHNKCGRGVGGKGWRGDQTWKQNVKTVADGGDILELNGGIPTGEEARALISEAKGILGAYHNAHPVGGISTHTYNHIHYKTATGLRSTIQVLSEL